MTAHGFAFFDTTIGRCGIAWGARGISGVQLPEASEAKTRARLMQRYARAREAQMDRWAEEIIEIADEGSNDWMDRQQGGETSRVVDHEHVHRSRLRVDAPKWLMAKLAPKRYGDKTVISGDGGAPLVISVIRCQRQSEDGTE